MGPLRRGGASRLSVRCVAVACAVAASAVSVSDVVRPSVEADRHGGLVPVAEVRALASQPGLRASSEPADHGDDPGTPLACVPYTPAFQFSPTNCVRSRVVPNQPDQGLRRSPLNALDSTRQPKGLGTGKPDTNDPTREYVLPAEVPGEPVLPGKIAFDRAHDRYFVAELFDGTIYRGRLGSDRAELFLPGVLPADFNGSFGVQVDNHDRLYVLDSAQAVVEVDNADTGRRLATFHTAPAPAPTGFLDSAAVTPNGDVYITDSLRPTLFRIPADRVETGGGVQEIPLGHGIHYTVAPGLTGPFNVRGIVALDDHHLIVAQTNTDKLFRLTLNDNRTAAAIDQIPVAGGLTNPDGLTLAGDTLYAVDSPHNRVLGIRLNSDWSHGTVVSRITDDTLASPTGIASTGDRLLVSNSQLYTLPMREPYTVSSIKNPTPDK